jgi:uncharacterized protein YecT (DUF1311 family)
MVLDIGSFEPYCLIGRMRPNAALNTIVASLLSGAIFMRAAGVLVCACLGLAAGSAMADECADQSQQGLNQCAEAAYEAADKALNAAYRKVAERLNDDPPTMKLLVAAQKAWIAFRDAECTFANASNVGGSIYPMVRAGCMERITKIRTKELDGYLDCQEGSFCPTPKK